jgi:hypothetical protein
MQEINLYRYVVENGIQITPCQKNENDDVYKIRLVADNGMILKKGDNLAYVVDVEINDVENWEEIEDETVEEDEEFEEN